MPDPTLHTVVDKVVTALVTAKAGTIYEPGAGNVVAMSDWPALETVTVDTFYAVIPGGTTETPEVRGLPDSGTLTGRLPIEVLALRRVSAAGSALQDAARWQVAADVSTDIEQKLVAAENARDGTGPVVTYLDGNIQVVGDWTDQWVVCQFRFSVRYRKERATR